MEEMTIQKGEETPKRGCSSLEESEVFVFTAVMSSWHHGSKDVLRFGWMTPRQRKNDTVSELVKVK